MIYHIMFFIICLIQGVYAVALGTTACSTYNGAQSTCEGLGYCIYLSGSCLKAECQKVTEPAACRSGGILNGVCADLQTYYPPLNNVCRENAQGTFVWAYAKFPYDTSQATTTTATLNSIPVTTLISTTQTALYKYQVLTLNILKSQNGDLTNHLLAYLHMQNELQDPEIAPFYVEKAIYESLQSIRDDATMTDALRQPLLTKVWRLVDECLFRKLRDYQAYYISSYYFVGIGFTDLNRLSLSVNCQLQTFNVQWTSYAENGYMQVTWMSLEQFGYLGALSDAVHIEAVRKSDGTTIPTQSFFFTWVWQDPTLPVVSSIKLFSFDRVLATATQSSTVSCVLANKICTTLAINTPGTYFLALSTSTNPICTNGARNSRAKCRLKFCNWSEAGSCS